MNQIIQYIELNLEDYLSIKQLAGMEEYSEYYFIRHLLSLCLQERNK